MCWAALPPIVRFCSTFIATCGARMVTSKELPSATPRPRRKRSGATFVLLLLITATIALGGVALFLPTHLGIAQEYIVGALHGGVAERYEEHYVDGCVTIPGADGPRAVTRTRRYTTFRDGTTLEVVFSGRPVPTNACP
jgi:hypothetical protein